MFEKGTHTAGEQWGTTQTYGGTHNLRTSKASAESRYCSGEVQDEAAPLSRHRNRLSVSQEPNSSPVHPDELPPCLGPHIPSLGHGRQHHASPLRVFLSSVTIQPATWCRISAPGSYGMVLFLSGSSTWQRVGGQHPSEMEARPQHPPKEVSRSWLFTNKAHRWEHRDDCSQDLNYRLYTFP